MTVELYVCGDLALRQVTFTQQREGCVLYRAEVPPESAVRGEALVLKSGKTLTAYEVYMAAKIEARGFRILPQTGR